MGPLLSKHSVWAVSTIGVDAAIATEIVKVVEYIQNLFLLGHRATPPAG
jgi:hypothetical protein